MIVPPDILKLIPEFQCHKIVRAAEILKVTTTGGGGRLHLKDGEASGLPGIDFGADWFAKHRPKEGDMLVVYSDGYVSVSPSKVFAEGYAPKGELPKIVVVMEGGVLHQVLSERPVDLIKVDYDVDGANPDKLVSIPQKGLGEDGEGVVTNDAEVTRPAVDVDAVAARHYAGYVKA